MRKTLAGSAAAAAIAALCVMAGGPAAAQVVGPRLAVELAKPDASVMQVQWRRRGWRGGRYWGWGPAAGFATGLIIGGAFAPRPYFYGHPYYYGAYPAQVPPEIVYCMRRFKSYDPGSRTYLGFDGFRHPCP